MLREAVAARFTARGVPTSADQILITNGALHGWDLLLRLLIGPGDRVLTELPTYPGALDAVRGNGGRVVPVPMAAGGGWQVDQLQATLRQTAPRLAYLTPDFHNPTGALIDERARRDVLRAARQTGTTVVVDESFVDLGFCARERPTRRPRPGRRHDRLAVQAGLGRAAHRLDARLGRPRPPAGRPARLHRHGRAGARPARRGPAVRRSSTTIAARAWPNSARSVTPARGAGPRAAAVAHRRAAGRVVAVGRTRRTRCRLR